MIYKIQQALKDILILCTDLPEKSICLTKTEEGQMQALPWASILPESQRLSPVWQWEQFIHGVKTIKIRQKYQASLPLRLAVRRSTAEAAAADAEAFLQALPHRIALDGSVVVFTPLAVSPQFGVGAMDDNTVHISVAASYGIYAREDVEMIKKVTVAVK